MSEQDMPKPRAEEEFAKAEIIEVYRMFEYGDEEMMKALNDLNPHFGQALIHAAAACARAFATQECATLQRRVGALEQALTWALNALGNPPDFTGLLSDYDAARATLQEGRHE